MTQMKKSFNRKWVAKDYVVIPRKILSAPITPTALRTWLALASFCYDSDECFPSNAALLDRMPEGTSLRSVQRAKKELEAHGYLQQERQYVKGRETSSLYTLTIPLVDTSVESVDSREGDNTVTPDEATGPRGGRTDTQNNTIRILKNRGDKKTVDGDVFVEGVGWITDS